MRFLALLGSSLTAFLVACGPGGPPPVTPDMVARAGQQKAGTDQATLEAGRELYVARCAGCHALYDPADHTEAEWGPIMETMGKRAKLDATGQEQVTRYVMAAAKR